MWSLIASLWRVFLHAFRRRETIQYPEEKPSLAPRWRGRIVLSRDPDGEERCVACYLCAVACPVDCIALQATAQDRQAAQQRPQAVPKVGDVGNAQQDLPVLIVPKTQQQLGQRRLPQQNLKVTWHPGEPRALRRCQAIEDHFRIHETRLEHEAGASAQVRVEERRAEAIVEWQDGQHAVTGSQPQALDDRRGVRDDVAV